MLKFCESLTETMFSFTNLVMYFAPVGVGAAMAGTVGHMDWGVVAAGKTPAHRILCTDCVLIVDPLPYLIWRNPAGPVC
jgi:Na+/H+-dicarboxylate symporter